MRGVGVRKGCRWLMGKKEGPGWGRLAKKWKEGLGRKGTETISWLGAPKESRTVATAILQIETGW